MQQLQRNIQEIRKIHMKEILIFVIGALAGASAAILYNDETEQISSTREIKFESNPSLETERTI